MADDFCGRIKTSRMDPECHMAGCPLPIFCHGHCDTCLLHCAGCTNWWGALRYWLAVWWQAGPERSQGGWYFRDWWEVFAFLPGYGWFNRKMCELRYRLFGLRY